MANIFGILTAIVMAVSLWIGYKNNAEFEKQVTAHEKADRKLAKTQDDRKKLLAKIEAEEERNVTVNENLEKNQKALAEREDEVATLTRKKAKIDKEIARNDKKIAEIETALEDLPDPDLLIPQIATAQKKIAQSKVDIASEQETLEFARSGELTLFC